MKSLEILSHMQAGEIERVLIVGAGSLGREIGLQCARHGVAGSSTIVRALSS